MRKLFPASQQERIFFQEKCCFSETDSVNQDKSITEMINFLVSRKVFLHFFYLKTNFSYQDPFIVWLRFDKKL